MLVFAYANEEGPRRLQSLDSERSKLQEILWEWSPRSDFVQNATPQRVVDACLRHDQQLTLFHYSGHADHLFLALEGPARTGMVPANSIAQLLGAQEALRLVVLNGCETEEHVPMLRSAGVKAAVVATCVAVRDEVAAKFAEYFYSVLSRGKSIRYAFSAAERSVNVTFGVAGSDHQRLRDVERSRGKKVRSSPWLMSGEPEVLDTSLIETSTSVPPRNLPDRPEPYFARAQILRRAVECFDAPIQANAREYKLCVLHGPSGFGKSSIASEIGRVWAQGRGRTHFCYWPQRPSELPIADDLVIIDGLLLPDGGDSSRLNWIAHLDCRVLITTYDETSARRLLGHLALAQHFERVVVRVEPLLPIESLEFIKERMAPARFEGMQTQIEEEVQSMGGSPFFLRIYVEMVNAGGVNIVQGIGSIFIQRLTTAWMRRLRMHKRGEYDVLRFLCRVPEVGTSPEYLAGIMGRDESEIAAVIAQLRASGLVVQPLGEDDGYTVPHDLARQAFGRELSASEAGIYRQQYVEQVLRSVQKASGRLRSFSSTLDAMMLATIQAFNARDPEMLQLAAVFFGELRRVEKVDLTSDGALRWLHPWIIETISQACASVVAVARTLQRLPIRCELLGDVIADAILHPDTYASAEAILAATHHWLDTSPREQDAAADCLVEKGCRMVSQPHEQESMSWLLGLQLFTLSCSIEVLSGPEKMKEAQARWYRVRSQQLDWSYMWWLYELAELLRNFARGDLTRREELRSLLPRCSEMWFLEAFVAMEAGVAVYSASSTPVVCGFDVLMLLIRAARYANADECFMEAVPYVRDGNLTMTSAQFSQHYGQWRRSRGRLQENQDD